MVIHGGDVPLPLTSAFPEVCHEHHERSEDSPFLSWLYAVTGVRGASRVIGVAEIAIALMIATRPFSSRVSAAGSVGAIFMFVTTLSFLATTPGSWAVVDGLVVPPGAGGFLIKDLLLLGAAAWTAGESMMASTRR